MKKKILNLSLILALFIISMLAINMPVYATTEDINSEEVCTHAYATTTKVTPAVSTTQDGKREIICSHCNQVVSTIVIPKINYISYTSNYTYSGYDVYQYVTLYDNRGSLINSSDYTVSYKKSGKTVKKLRDVGTYTITINLKNNYSGVITKTFKINPKTVKKSNLYIENVTYTGKATQPKTIYCNGYKLKKGTDYTISKLSNNKKYGTAKVTFKFKGNYKGTVNTTYKISPAKVTKLKSKKRTESSVTFSWKKVKNATGYKVYRYDLKKGKYTLYKTTSSTSATVKRSSKDYSYIDIYVVAYKKVGKKSHTSTPVYCYDVVKPGKIKYSTSTPSKGKVKVSYKGVKKNTYKYIQVQISTNKAFNKKKAKVQNVYGNASSYSKNTEVSNLKSKKTYYVRCREYNYDMNGKKVYGSWGTVQKIKVK